MTVQEALKVIERYSYVNEPTQDDMQKDFDEALEVLINFIKLHTAADN